MLFTDIELDYLRSPGRLGRLATMRDDGTLQVNPVGIHVNTALDAIDIGGRDMAASRKFKNVQANGRVALVVDDVASVDRGACGASRSAVSGRCSSIRQTPRCPGPGP